MLHLPIYLLIKYIIYFYNMYISLGFMHTIAFSVPLSFTQSVIRSHARIPHTIVNGNTSYVLLHFCIPVSVLLFLSTLFMLGRVSRTHTHIQRHGITNNLHRNTAHLLVCLLKRVCILYIMHKLHKYRSTFSLPRHPIRTRLRLHFLLSLRLFLVLFVCIDAFNWKYFICVYCVEYLYILYINTHKQRHHHVALMSDGKIDMMVFYKFTKKCMHDTKMNRFFFIRVHFPYIRCSFLQSLSFALTLLVSSLSLHFHFFVSPFYFIINNTIRELLRK